MDRVINPELHDQDVPKYILKDVEEKRKQISAIFDK